MSKQQEQPAEWADPKTLVPWGKNPRKNSAAVKKVAESIQRFGFGAPIIARRDGREIIAGHTRRAAALSLGMERVPVRFLDVSEADAHKLAIADNKLGELSEWDDAALADVLGSFSLADCAALGFDAKSLEALGDVLAPAENEDGGAKLGSGLAYKVVVDCRDEEHQAEMLERLESEGLVCRPLIS